MSDENEEVEEEQKAKVILKLKRRHPANKYRVQGHIITPKEEEFLINEAEWNELQSEGCKYWIEIVKVCE